MIATQAMTCCYCGHETIACGGDEPLCACAECGAVLPLAARFRGPVHAIGCLDPLAPTGIILGKYRLIEPLRHSPDVRSYLAEHVYLNYECIAKVLVADGACRDTAESRRVRDELRGGFRILDRHVVRLLDCDYSDWAWFAVSEYVSGTPLTALVGRGRRLPWRQVLRIGTDAGRGLAAIHRAGLTHGRVRPANLLLGADGATRISDVGIARIRELLGPTGDAAREGVLDAYAAPETLWADAAPGALADLYALGVILYRLLTGRPPHANSKSFARLLARNYRDVEWPANNTDVPDELRAAIACTLHPDPTGRTASAAEFVAALEALSEDPQRPSTIFTMDALRPRGVGVLPFVAAADQPGEDWLGYAIATGVARRLAELPDLYVADVDGFVGTLHRLQGEPGLSARDRMEAAARLVGAGTVLSGRVARNGDRVRVTLEITRDGDQEPATIGSIGGAIQRLPLLEQELVRRVAQEIGARAAERPAAASELAAPPPDARERLVRARQRYLSGDYGGAAELAAAAVVTDPDYADAIGFVGVCQARLGHYAEAESNHRRQLALGEQWRDDRVAMEALANLGVMHYFRGEFVEAERHYRRAAELARQLGLAVDHAHVSNNLGFVLLRLGRHDEAETAFRQAIETHRAYGALASLVGPYSGMGNVLSEQKRHGEARTYYRRALALAAEVGDRTSVGTTHMHLGRCAALQGRIDEAKHEYATAIGLLEATGFWNGLARAFEYIIELNVELGDLDEAAQCADRRIELARRYGNAGTEAAAIRQKADLLAKAGRVPDADRRREPRPDGAAA